MGFRARSWEALVFQSAMLHVEPRRLAHGRAFSVSPRRAAETLPRDATGAKSAAATIDAIAASLSLAVAWPSVARIRIAVGEDFTLLAQLDEGNRMLVRTFASAESALERITADLAAQLGATKATWMGPRVR